MLQAMCLKIPPTTILKMKYATEIVGKADLPTHGENSPTPTPEESVWQAYIYPLKSRGFPCYVDSETESLISFFYVSKQIQLYESVAE